MLCRARLIRSLPPRHVVVALALLLAASGCKPTDPLSEKIAAADSTTLFRWQRDVGSQLTPEMQRQFETTLAELRLDIQFRQEASGHDAIEAAVCKRLNQLPVKDALLLGAQLKWRRLAGEREDLQRVVNGNAHLVTKPGDLQAAADLDLYRANHQKRLDATIQELQVVEKEIQALGGSVPTLDLPAPATKPIAVSRDEARKQIADLLQSRRTAAAVSYGDWPVKVDWEGRQLNGEKRAEFLAKQAANAHGEKAVMAVRIKGRWLIFETADQAPALPEDVKAQLTAAEAAAFKKDWLELEAERWAREVAKDLVDPSAAPERAPDAPPVLPGK